MSRAHTISLIRQLAAIGHVKPKRKVGRWPAPRPPSAIGLAYRNAIVRNVCEQMRAAFDKVVPDIMRELLELRRLQGREDGRADAGFSEEDHPRDENGRFASGGAGHVGGGALNGHIAGHEHALAGRATEKVVVLKPSGEVAFEQEGDVSGTDLSAHQREQIAGNVLTHNHPGGTSLSLGDVARNNNAAEIRAVSRTPDGKVVAYSVRRPDAGWPSAAAIENAHSEAHSAVLERMREEPDTIPPLPTKAAARQFIAHETWKAAAKALGIPYHREEVPAPERADADDQPRQPAGSPEGGQFAPAGEGGGAAAHNATVAPSVNHKELAGALSRVRSAWSKEAFDRPSEAAARGQINAILAGAGINSPRAGDRHDRLELQEKRAMPTTRGFARGSAVHIREDVAKDAAAFARAAAKGEARLAHGDQVHGMQTIIHEAIHTHSQISGDHSVAHRFAIEEVTTELAARHVMATRFGPMATSSYTRIIGKASDLVQMHAGLPTRGHAYDALTRGAVAVRQERSAMSPDDAIRKLARGAGVPADRIDQFHKDFLEERWL